MVVMKKKIIIVVAFILGITIILNQIGWLDINLYKSELGSNQSLYTSKKNIGTKESFSFNLTFKNQDKIQAQHTYEDGKSPPISIECRLEEMVYSGNYRLPFYKVFKVEYKCNIITVEPDSGKSVEGKVEGDINAKIIGLCNSKKVKDIVLKEITKSIMNILPNHLQN
jgi:hypothetical protein